MQEISLSLWIFLAIAACMAGYMDAVVGGGGLIQLPALLGSLPAQSTAALLGTNKVSSLAGTSMAAWRYIRAVKVQWSVVLPMMGIAGLASWWGAQLVSLVPRAHAQPVILVVLVMVAVFTFMRKDFGLYQRRPAQGVTSLVFTGSFAAALLGFYDGALGPGTGAFLMFFFVRFFGYDFVHASAASKAINWTTNVAALLFFLPMGQVIWGLGLMMALCNVLGAYWGTRMAVARGSRFVRRLFLFVLCFMIARMAWVTWESLF